MTADYDKTAREIVAINAPMLSPNTQSDLALAIAAAIEAAAKSTTEKRNMDINNLTLGQIKEVASIATGLCTAPQASSPVDGGEVRIVVLQRGWIVVGYYSRANGRIKVSRASVLRRWGTSKGLGELIGGPKSDTVLDPCGDVDAHELAEVLTIKCDAAKWSVLK